MVLLDLAAVLVFVLAGRRSHGESDGLAGIWTTAWPFLIGVAGGYLGLVLTRWAPMSLRGGAMVAAKTVVLGLVVRYGIQDNSFPPSFAIVAAVVLTVLMLGWRLIAGSRAWSRTRTR